MSWIIEIVFDAYGEIVDTLCKKQPWWVWALWTFGPLLLIGLVIAAVLFS